MTILARSAAVAAAHAEPRQAATRRVPQAEIANRGVQRDRATCPTPQSGYYRGTRFDWSGAIASLTLERATSTSASGSSVTTRCCTTRSPGRSKSS